MIRMRAAMIRVGGFLTRFRSGVRLCPTSPITHRLTKTLSSIAKFPWERFHLQPGTVCTSRYDEAEQLGCSIREYPGRLSAAKSVEYFPRNLYLVLDIRNVTVVS